MKALFHFSKRRISTSIRNQFFIGFDELNNLKDNNKEIVLVGPSAIQLVEMNKKDFHPTSESSIRGFLDEMKEKRINHDAKIVCVDDDIAEAGR